MAYYVEGHRKGKDGKYLSKIYSYFVKVIGEEKEGKRRIVVARVDGKRFPDPGGKYGYIHGEQLQNKSGKTILFAVISNIEIMARNNNFIVYRTK